MDRISTLTANLGHPGCSWMGKDKPRLKTQDYFSNNYLKVTRLEGYTSTYIDVYRGWSFPHPGTEETVKPKREGHQLGCLMHETTVPCLIRVSEGVQFGFRCTTALSSEKERNRLGSEKKG
jgi:hypothetical protein